MDISEGEKPMQKMIALAMASMEVAVTIIDPKGKMLYYNPHAAGILDRKPEHIGTDIQGCHKKAASNQRVDGMLQAFAKGRKASFQYEARPYGKPILVTVSPIFDGEEFVGCVQTVRPGETPPPAGEG